MEETKVLHKKKVLAPKLRFKGFDEAWNKSLFEDVADKNVKWSITGGPFGSNLKSSDYTVAGVRILQLQNLGDGVFLDDYKIYTSEEKANELISCNIYPNDIILSKMGDPVARACIIPNSETRFLMASDGIRLVVDEKRFSKYYIFSYINHPLFRTVAISNSTGSTRKRIGLGELKIIPINHPSLPEQQKIAGFLSAVDEKIQLLNRKKQLFEQYKNGAMQQLFSGKLRFKDENGKAYPKWEKKKLGQVGEIVSGLTYSPNDVHQDGVLVLRSSNVQDRTLSFENNVYVNVSEGNFNPVKENDILICVRNGSKNLIGKNAIIDEKNAGVAFGAFMTVFRSDYNLFLFHYFDTDMYKNEVHKNLGATINSINGSDLKKFKIPFPSEPEQKKIADFLSAIDVKIESLSNQISQTQNFKKGLLQQMFV